MCGAETEICGAELKSVGLKPNVWGCAQICRTELKCVGLKPNVWG